jgi:hypothetical protein
MRTGQAFGHVGGEDGLVGVVEGDRIVAQIIHLGLNAMGCGNAHGRSR